jgi:hypothetical protein
LHRRAVPRPRGARPAPAPAPPGGCGGRDGRRSRWAADGPDRGGAGPVHS